MLTLDSHLMMISSIDFCRINATASPKHSSWVTKTNTDISFTTITNYTCNRPTSPHNYQRCLTFALARNRKHRHHIATRGIIVTNHVSSLVRVLDEEPDKLTHTPFIWVSCIFQTSSLPDLTTFSYDFTRISWKKYSSDIIGAQDFCYSLRGSVAVILHIFHV